MSVAPKYDRVPIDEGTLAIICGNATASVKRTLLQILATQCVPGLFGASIAQSMRIVKADVLSRKESPARVESVVVWEVDVTQEMIDERGNLAIGCFAFFIDMFSTFPLVVQGAHECRPGDLIGVSHSMHFVFHASARLGARLRAISTCVSLGSRTRSARCEVWDIGRNHAICSAVHVKMAPSLPKL